MSKKNDTDNHIEIEKRKSMTQSLEKLSVMLFINGFILFQKLLQIRLRRRNRRDAEVLHQIIQHIRRQESREGGAEPDIFNPQMQ